MTRISFARVIPGVVREADRDPGTSHIGARHRCGSARRVLSAESARRAEIERSRVQFSKVDLLS